MYENNWNIFREKETQLLKNVFVKKRGFFLKKIKKKFIKKLQIFNDKLKKRKGKKGIKIILFFNS